MGKYKFDKIKAKWTNCQITDKDKQSKYILEKGKHKRRNVRRENLRTSHRELKCQAGGVNYVQKNENNLSKNGIYILKEEEIDPEK